MTPQRFSFVLLTTCLLVPLLSPADAAGLGSGDASVTLMDLDGSNLRGMDLHGWDLRYADLDGADLRGADLSGALLLGASLKGARLDGASLRGADLRLADLTGVSLRGADLRDADLSSAQVAPIAADATQWSGAICPNDRVAGEAGCEVIVPAADVCATPLVETDGVPRPLPAASAPGRRAAL